MNETAHPPVASYEEWLAARKAILEEEKQLTRLKDKLAAKRRRLPMVKLEETYTFEGSEGIVTLADLFEGHDQLIVYHFMFDPDWEKGCPGCTGFIDEIGNLDVLGKRRTRFVVISRAPLPKLEAYKKEHGWKVPWYSSFESDFNYDFHTTIDETKAPFEINYRTKEEFLKHTGRNEAPSGEMPGLSVFFRVGKDVFHCYSTFGRGVENLLDTYSMLDVTPYGRQEDWEDSPEGWPQSPTYG